MRSNGVHITIDKTLARNVFTRPSSSFDQGSSPLSIDFLSILGRYLIGPQPAGLQLGSTLPSTCSFGFDPDTMSRIDLVLT